MRCSILIRTKYDVWEIEGKFYPVLWLSSNQIADIGGRDKPLHPCSHNVARPCEAGVKYVSSPSPTRRAALARIRRALKEVSHA